MKINRCIPAKLMRPLALLILLLANRISAHAGAAVYFDVAAATDHATSLPATFTNDAQALVTVSALTAHNVNPSYDCCIEGLGDFIFTGWSVKEGPIDWDKYLEFSVTAKAPISFTTLKYSAFGGNWSNIGGPRGVIVKASRDAFVSEQMTLRSEGWNVQQTTPYITDSPNDFVDELSALGQLAAGQTMTFRFYMVYTDYGHIPGGLWNKSTNDHNLTMSFTSVAPLTIRISQVELCWGTVTNMWYQVQFRSSLTTNAWLPLAPGWVAGTGGLLYTTDAIPRGSVQTFYRMATTNSAPQ